MELVPFDSQALNDVSADAWGTGTESYAFEDTDTLARCVYEADNTCNRPHLNFKPITICVEAYHYMCRRPCQLKLKFGMPMVYFCLYRGQSLSVRLRLHMQVLYSFDGASQHAIGVPQCKMCSNFCR